MLSHLKRAFSKSPLSAVFMCSSCWPFVTTPTERALNTFPTLQWATRETRFRFAPIKMGNSCHYRHSHYHHYHHYHHKEWKFVSLSPFAWHRIIITIIDAPANDNPVAAFCVTGEQEVTSKTWGTSHHFPEGSSLSLHGTLAQLDDLCIDICISLMIKSLSHYPDNREMGYSNVLIYEGPRMKHTQNEARDVYIYIKLILLQNLEICCFLWNTNIQHYWSQQMFW